jgi:hypothetical protein
MGKMQKHPLLLTGTRPVLPPPDLVRQSQGREVSGSIVTHSRKGKISKRRKGSFNVGGG